MSSDTQNASAVADDRLAELAETMGVDCVHLDDLTAEDAELAIAGVALYAYLQPAGRGVIDEHIASLPRGCRAAFRRARERHGRGAVIYENDSGSQRIVEGQSFDWDRLGIQPQRHEHHGINFEYLVIGDQFVLFPTKPDEHDADKEEPTRYYYIQSARVGSFNSWTAFFFRYFSMAYAPATTVKTVRSIPGGADVLARLTKLQGASQFWGPVFGLALAQTNVPIWGDIVATEVPDIGTSIIIVYVSNDRQDWSRRVRFEVLPNGEVDSEPF